MSHIPLSAEAAEQLIDQRLGVFVAHTDDQFDRVLFVLDEMQDEIRGCARQTGLEEVKTDLGTVKLAVTATNRSLRHREKRVERLEVALQHG